MSECWGDEPGAARLREVFGCFPSGVVALCSLVDDTPVGIAASSFTSVSLAPPLVSVCVQHTSETWPVLRQRPKLGLSVLSEVQDEAGRRLSLKRGNRFAGVDWAAGVDGSVLLRDVSAWLVASVHAEIDAGDHVLVLLRVHQLDCDPATPPLVFHRSRFRRLATPPTTPEGDAQRAAQ